MTRMRSSIERIFSKFPRHAVIAVVVIAGGMILIFGGGLKMDTCVTRGEDYVDALLACMSIEEKVGQMVMAGFPPGKIAGSEGKA